MSLSDFIRPHEDLVFMTELLKSSSKQEQAAGSASRPSSVYDKIKEQKRALENEQWNVASKKRDAAALREEIQGLTKRHQARAKRLKLSELEALQQEIQRIEDGSKMRDFEKLTQPYIEECQKQHFCRSSVEKPEDLFGEVSKASLIVDDYLVNVKGCLPKFQIQNSDLCQRCSSQMQLHQTLSMLICSGCGLSKQYMDATASLQAYSDELDFSSFSYKRINHFGEHLQSLQARESIEVPEEVLTQVMSRLYDERVDRSEDVTIHKVREILKKLKLRKYYEHVQLITCKITGRTPPRMTPEMEERIKVCFLAASAAFQRHIPEGRKNMVSYTFVCQKLCMLLGYTEFIPFFSQLKSRDKMVKAELCWARICKDLNWPFIPSPI
jgi:Poxvirus Late Transcription Factor VLTF3 like